MKTNKWTFSVHTYAPELNKVYYNGKDISSLISDTIRKSLTKTYRTNVRLIRNETLFKVATFKHFVEIKYNIPNARYGYGEYFGFYFKHSDISEFLRTKDKYHNLDGTTRTVRLYTKYI